MISTTICKHLPLYIKYVLHLNAMYIHHMVPMRCTFTIMVPMQCTYLKTYCTPFAYQPAGMPTFPYLAPISLWICGSAVLPGPPQTEQSRKDLSTTQWMKCTG